MELAQQQPQKTRPEPKKNIDEVKIFRLRRNRADDQQDIILLEDRPNKRFKLESFEGLDKQLNKLNISQPPKEEQKEQPKEETKKESEEKFVSSLFDSAPQQKYLKRVNLQELSEEPEIMEFAHKMSQEHHRKIRKELLRALRGEAPIDASIKVHDIDCSRFLIVNGEKVPFRKVGGDSYKEDYYVYCKDRLNIGNGKNYPILECPRELEQEFTYEAEDGRSSVDSQDSNDQDNSQNDYPDEQEMEKMERDSFDEEDIYRNDNDSLVDEDQECDNQEDFCERIRRKRAERRIQREDYEEDEEEY